MFYLLTYSPTLYDQSFALSKSCFSYTRQLRCIRPYLDLKTVSTIATSIVHSNQDNAKNSSDFHQTSYDYKLLLQKRLDFGIDPLQNGWMAAIFIFVITY